LFSVPLAAQADSAKRSLCSRLRLLRQSLSREELVAQWRQSMTAPEWSVRLPLRLFAKSPTQLACNREAEDYDWRPTFKQRMRREPLSRANNCSAVGVLQNFLRADGGEWSCRCG